MNAMIKVTDEDGAVRLINPAFIKEVQSTYGNGIKSAIRLDGHDGWIRVRDSVEEISRQIAARHESE